MKILTTDTQATIRANLVNLAAMFVTGSAPHELATATIGLIDGPVLDGGPTHVKDPGPGPIPLIVPPPPGPIPLIVPDPPKPGPIPLIVPTPTVSNDPKPRRKFKGGGIEL